MADKQPQLNGAYYGPSIPMAEPPRHRGRGCCCCLFSFFWKLLLAIIIFVVLVFLVFCAVVQPRAFKVNVTEARLTQFNYTDSSNTLRYNLVLNFTARNPNKRLSIYYDKAEGHVSYGGVRFASADVVTWRNAFLQQAKSAEDPMGAVFAGQHVMVLDKDHVSGFKEDERKGVFGIGVRLHLTIRFELGDFVGGDTKTKAKCELEVPLSSKGAKVVTVFQPTKCDVQF
ncbi:hypothetical protein Fmac_027395 [Flemingia macrophylla]|uniref:Late embryogenesis abundant protein LEA-2 subgroup domain-containing protein n=1 Tax=Flemingia macrophylla TaxID=520843 RepID=A0ABD1LHU4_9FABA